MSYFQTGGDLTGGFPTPTVAKIQGVPVVATGASNTEVMTFNAGAWGPAAASGGGGVTQAIGTPDQVTVSAATGDVTFSLPQSIATTSTPTFNNLTLSNRLLYPNNNIQVGTNSSATGAPSIALGGDTTASGLFSVAIGNGASLTEFTTIAANKTIDGGLIARDDTIGLYFAKSSTVFSIETSPDGITWTTRALGSPGDIAYSVAYSPSLGLVICGAGNGAIFSSPDGFTWTLRTTISNGFRVVQAAWSSTLNLFVVWCNLTTNFGNDNVPATSTDGINWTTGTIINLGVNGLVTGLIWTGTVFVMTARTGNGTITAIFVSANGTSWTQYNINVGGLAYLSSGIAYSPTLNRLTITGTRGTAYSDNDGVTWTQGSIYITGPQYFWGYPIWVPTLSIFVTLGGQAGGGTDTLGAAISSDGITWTQITTPDSNYRYQRLTFSSTLNYFIGNSAISTSNLLYAETTSLVEATATGAIAIGGQATGVNSIAFGSGIIANQPGGFFVKHRDSITPSSALVGIYDTVSNELVGLPDAGSSGQVLTSNSAGGLSWTTPGGGLPALANNNMWLGNGSNVATAVSIGGDVSSINTGAITLNTIQGVTVLANGTSRNISIGNSTHANLNTDCIAIGNNALNAANANTGPGHIAIGTDTLTLVTNFVVDANVAIGYNAAKLSTNGGNVAIGHDALAGNTGGASDNENTFIGWKTGASANLVRQSTLIGAGVCMSVSGGLSNCVGIGRYCMRFNSSIGIGNTAIGSDCMRFCPAGEGNTALGYEAMFRFTGSNNTCIGRRSGNNLGGGVYTGSNNQLIGYSANASGLGASNEFVLGNNAINVLRCQVNSISTLSDRRDKKNIVPIPAGLDFVNRLTPVEFDWNMRDGSKVDVKEFGFIAQDLQQVQIDTGVVIPGLVYESNPEKIEAAQGTLLPAMVKAIQELSAELNAAKARISELEK